MGCEGGGHPQVETRTLGGADARSRGTQEEEDGTSLEGSPGLPRGLGQTALSIWTALNDLAQEEEAARSLRTPHAHSNAFTLYMATQRTCTHTHVHTHSRQTIHAHSCAMLSNIFYSGSLKEATEG